MTKRHDKPLRVAELFAGVGGFRLGLCGEKDSLDGYKVVWANQWEPATNVQHAALVYRKRFHDGGEPNRNFNRDIFWVLNNDFSSISEHDVLVGGFPCQDYSVARTLSHAKGLEGKKGVLWWAIHGILKQMGDKAPKYLMLENVDRLIGSPARQRGRDFGVMLASLDRLGYAVEWRVVNAADYGLPQRRRRVFILGYKKGSPIYRRLNKRNSNEQWMTETGVIARAFPVESLKDELHPSQELRGTLTSISNDFSHHFENTGLMKDGEFVTFRTHPSYSGKRASLRQILIKDERKIPPEFYLDTKDEERWKKLKGAKAEERTAKSGFKYIYKEGAVAFPEPLGNPSRTIITGEGGPTPARHKHVVLTSSGRLRRLHPIELERLCMFPDNHTELEGISHPKRAFFMGNALVVGVIEKLGRSLLDAHRL